MEEGEKKKKKRSNKKKIKKVGLEKNIDWILSTAWRLENELTFMVDF